MYERESLWDYLKEYRECILDLDKLKEKIENLKEWKNPHSCHETEDMLHMALMQLLAAEEIDLKHAIKAARLFCDLDQHADPRWYS